MQTLNKLLTELRVYFWTVSVSLGILLHVIRAQDLGWVNTQVAFMIFISAILVTALKTVVYLRKSLDAAAAR